MAACQQAGGDEREGVMRGISKLAQELGLSTGTISRALNGKPDVHEKTRRRVLDAARQLGYEPNQAARALARGRTQSVGFMMDLDPQAAASGDSFFMGVFDGVHSVLMEHGLDLHVLPCPSRQDRFAYLDRLVARRVVDAMILSNTGTADPRVGLLQAAGIPFVTFGRTKSPKGFSWVDLDFEGVAESAVERLVSLGHRRIALTVPFGDLNFGVVFKTAYRKALEKRGIAFDPALVFSTGLGDEDGYYLVDELLGGGPPVTAVILIFEAAAIGMYRRLSELGLKPGEDLSIIGLRDELAVRNLAPRLTCFDVPLHDIGVALSEALLAQMGLRSSSGRSPFVHLRVPLGLRPGGSDGTVRSVSPKKR
jgi:DNA-binding LacI/PurR family transcriptional regulator